MNHIPFCDCCGSSPFALRRRLAPLNRAELVATVHADLAHMTASDATCNGVMAMVTRPSREAGQDAAGLAMTCVQFLLVKEELRDEGRFRKRVPDARDPDKYISLWSFVYSCLGITKDSGYDYFLLCWLEHNGIIEHGCSIRCAWLTDECRNVPRMPQVKELIAQWAETAPDDV